MRAYWLIVAVVALAIGPGEPARQVDSGPRHRAVVTCFNNPQDEAGSYCSGTCYQEDGTLFKTGKMTCGFKGSVSEIEWTFIGQQGAKDRYRFTRRFPVNSPGTTTALKDIEFDGERVRIFEDKSQRIVMDRPRK
jgi:hypothetical protein